MSSEERFRILRETQQEVQSSHSEIKRLTKLLGREYLKVVKSQKSDLETLETVLEGDVLRKGIEGIMETHGLSHSQVMEALMNYCQSYVQGTKSISELFNYTLKYVETIDSLLRKAEAAGQRLEDLKKNSVVPYKQSSTVQSPKPAEAWIQKAGSSVYYA